MPLARFVVPLLLTGCLCSAQGHHAPATSPFPPPRAVSATIAKAALAEESGCSAAFVTHRLDFTTGTRLREINTYISNGAGVAANDLDNDGDMDLVFASVDREAEILWNDGDLKFTPQPLDDRFGRGTAIVDVDADGWNDIVFTHRGIDGVSYWRNQGNDTGRSAPLPFRPTFERQSLPGVDGYAYAMAWGDVDGDNDLDLVTGSYGVELLQHGIDPPAADPRSGIMLYVQEDGVWQQRVLSREAETLSIAIVDLTGDGRPEIWAANDFALDDLVWQRSGREWRAVYPFAQTSHSTMAIEWGDIENNGTLALFSTDMNPYDISPRTMAEWIPMMNQIQEHREAGDPQIMANVLQVQRTVGKWESAATERGIAASGWSWAARFGDLDQDGWLDLYVVNGMIAADMFGHLANGELVEENQAYRNRGNGNFTAEPRWQLTSTASGRGMVMSDMDGDGDLDIIVNNLRGFAQLFENQLCTGHSLIVDLKWPTTANRAAIGARLALHTDRGTFHRDVRASGSYLSGEPSHIHFGLPAGVTPDTLEITWPDGAVTNKIDVPADQQVTVTRSEP